MGNGRRLIYNYFMKPVVVLTLIASALSGKPRRSAGLNDDDAPLSGDDTRHELAVAITAIVVVAALILALVFSFLWHPDL